MSDIRVVGNQAPTTVSAGQYRSPWAGPLGSLATLPDVDALIRAGYGFHVTIGAFSTPITGGGAGTVFDQDQPEGIISVPSGSAIMPVRIDVQCQVPLMAADADESEILIAVDRTAAWPGDGTVTSETAFNMRTDNPISSVCTAASAATANITNPTLGVELAREVITGDVQGTATTVWWGRLRCLYEPLHPPLIVGPAAIYIYWGGTVATTGFAQVQWVEFPSSLNAVFD